MCTPVKSRHTPAVISRCLRQHLIQSQLPGAKSGGPMALIRLSPVVVVPPSAELDAVPINPNWIREGAPQARFKFLGKSEDGVSWHVVWECTEGRFDWHYDNDETAFILSGEVFISGATIKEHRVTAGDMILFAAGSTYTWRVTMPVRKFAVLRRTIPRPLWFAVRALNKFMQLKIGGAVANRITRVAFMSRGAANVSVRYPRVPGAITVSYATHRADE